MYGVACIATSTDGLLWRDLHSARDPKHDNVYCGDRSHSYLSRAADTYVTAVFDSEHTNELVHYRKDFGTPHGWREVRGAQVGLRDGRGVVRAGRSSTGGRCLQWWLFPPAAVCSWLQVARLRRNFADIPSSNQRTLVREVCAAKS